MEKKIYTPDNHKDLKKELGIGAKWKLKADVCIIGSGAGGAVAAAELARAGWKVVLIEEGSYFVGKFSNEEFAMQSRLYRDAGYALSEDQTARILQGRSLGGSTTVNWQTSLYPPDYVTNEWRDRFGLEGYARNETSGEFVEEVHKRLGVQRVPDHLVNRNNRVLLEGGEKLGLEPERLLNNNAGKCIGLGRCGLGCPINAKQSTYLTWIPDAIAAGALVFPNMRAEEISDGKMKTVKAVFCPDPFEKAPEDIIEEMEIEAPVVVLSAGSLEGPALLKRSGLGNDWVGRNLKIHPTAMILGRFDYKVDMWHGPPQSMVINAGHNQDNSGYGFWLEAAPLRPTLTAASMPLYGKVAIEQLKDYRNFHSGISLVRDGADGETNGSVDWSWGKRKIEYAMTPTDGRNMLRGLKMLAEVQAAAGARELLFPFLDMKAPVPVNPGTKFDWILKKSVEANTFTVFSAHPHGSIQAASTPERGAIAPNFELYGHKNIFVIDASWIPTGLSVNPQITTMSSALRAARKLAGEKAKRLSS